QAEQLTGAGEPETKAFFDVTITGGSIASNNFSFPDESARVKQVRGDIAGAIAVYRRLLTPDIGQKWTLTYEPRYVLEGGGRLAQRGHAPAPRPEYRRFAELWKSADPGLPELEEARKKGR